MPSLLVVTGSTRPGRVGGLVADWLLTAAASHGHFGTNVADLAAMDLPMMNEPEHPRLGKYLHGHTRNWSEMVTAADAAVFVMPEYNSGYAAPLKNAIDYLSREWSYLPVGLLAYGGASGGGRAIQALRPVLTNMRMVPTGVAVQVHRVAQHVEGGVFEPSAGVAQAVPAMLDELSELADALAAVRARSLA